MAYVAVVVAVTATGVMVSAMVLAAVMPIEQAIKNSHTPNSSLLKVLELNAAALRPGG